MFNFFFENLYYKPPIELAFKNICLEKMRVDGYFDMSIYIYGRMKKDDIRRRLSAVKSPYKVLYDESYPEEKEALRFWEQKVEVNLVNSSFIDIELSPDESSAIVSWIYRILKNADERIALTQDLFKRVKDFYAISSDVCLNNGVVYNKEKVEIYPVSSVNKVNELITNRLDIKENLFFRGHADANYLLCPSVMRTPNLIQNESNMYHDLLIECPDDFERCHTHLEKLVEMQHYGLPTRLLDITRNPLVALYFACESRPESYGELVLISADKEEIKYPQSDTVSVLASLPAFSYNEQMKFRQWAEDLSVNEKQFNINAKRLVHEVRLEKPAFEPDIRKEDVLKNYIVYAVKNNSRIVKQDGAFILCGLNDVVDSLDEFRYREKKKKIVALVTEKKRILRQLEAFSINRAALFPEIDFVSEYIRNKYL